MSATDETRVLLGRLYEAIEAGDPSAWVDNLADDVTGIGSDGAEWWEGRDPVAKVLAAQVKEMSAAGIKVRPGAPTVFTAGDVVWALDRPTVELPDGNSQSMRLTLITSVDNGRRVIRHFHMSTGTANEEILGEQLTTS